MDSGFYQNTEFPEGIESVVGTFPSLTRARSVVRELKEAGIPSEEISVVLAHPSAESRRPSRRRSRIPGPITIAALGGLVGALTASGIVTRRGGPSSRLTLLATVYGLAAAAAIGYLIGGLAGNARLSSPLQPTSGHPELRYPSPAIMVGATGRQQQLAKAKDILSRFGAVNLRIYGGSNSAFR